MYLVELPIQHDRVEAAKAGTKTLLGEGFTSTPSISRDGSRVSYVRRGLADFEIHTRELASGADRIVLRTQAAPRVRLSPDGSMLALNREFGEEVKKLELISWSSGENVASQESPREYSTPST